MNIKRLKGTKKVAELLREMSVNPDHSFALCHHAEFKCADCVFVGLFGCTCIGRSPCPQYVGVVDKHAPDRIRNNVERREVWRTLICFMAAMLEVEL